MADRRPRPVAVDREKTCPFLLRVFVKPGTHHDTDRDFQVPDRLPLPDESQLYAWKDTTLRDICLQLLDSSPSLRMNAPIKFSLRLVYLDVPRDLASAINGPPARYKAQDLGAVFSRDLAKSASGAPASSLRALQDLRFAVGDFIDVALVSSHVPTSMPAPLDVRPNFPNRGLARGLPGGTGGPGIDGPRWVSRAPAPPRWGSAPERRGGGSSDAGRPQDSGRWAHNANAYPDRVNGAGHRDGDRFRECGGAKWGNGSGRRRGDSRSRSSSLGRRGDGSRRPRR